MSVLTIAGSDPSGGAGIQADLATITSLGAYPCSVITALTAQNTFGVKAVSVVEPSFVEQQLAAIREDELDIRAVKTGMLGDQQVVKVVTAAMRGWKAPCPALVVDPVLVSTSGHDLLPTAALDALWQLASLARVITPNVPEAEVLFERATGKRRKLETLKDALEVGRDILDALAESPEAPVDQAVLVKGGHLTATAEDLQALGAGVDAIGMDEPIAVLRATSAGTDTLSNGSSRVIVDLLISRSDQNGATHHGPYSVTAFVAPFVASTSTHGTGCTLSAAIATELSRGASTRDACASAIRYVQLAIATAPRLGAQGGHGPVNHRCLSLRRELAAPTPVSPHPFVSHLIASSRTEWDAYVRHPFVDQLGQGTLPKDAFRHYIIQDWHYLRHYARAHALGAYKSESFDDIQAFSEIALHVARESRMHVEFCKSFGVTMNDLTSAAESPANAAYSRYILDVGAKGDVLDLLVAVASCLIGYGEVGLRLQHLKEGNPYGRWIEDYSGEEFQSAVQRGIAVLERRVAADPPSPARLAQLADVWRRCVQLECGFWQMGLDGN